MGDILLSRNDALQSSLIRSATGSGFSHAALFVHDGGVLIRQHLANSQAPAH